MRLSLRQIIIRTLHSFSFLLLLLFEKIPGLLFAGDLLIIIIIDESQVRPAVFNPFDRTTAASEATQRDEFKLSAAFRARPRETVINPKLTAARAIGREIAHDQKMLCQLLYIAGLPDADVETH